MGTRQSAQELAVAELDNGGFEADLSRLVAVRSESQTRRGLTDCRRYVERAVSGLLHDAGFSFDIFDNPVDGCGPVLLAKRIEDPGLPTILGYGHGDVVHGQEDAWTKGAGPWKLDRVGDKLFGRGTADNKGQHLINLRSLKAVLETRGRLGFNAKFVIETGEEVGSTGLREVMQANRDAFGADVLIASDGPRVAPDQPTISLGCRGAINFDMVCDLREGAHHSGNWGGALRDPAITLAHAIASITDGDGRILVPEWRPAPIPDRLRSMMAGLTLEGGPEVDPNWGEPDLSPAENVYGWNSFAVLAMSSGRPESPVNAISPTARAHCQLRFVAETDAATVLPALRRHLDRTEFGRLVRIDETDAERGFSASRTESDNPWVERVIRSVRATTGAAPSIIPQMGGSICNELFTDLLGIPAIWLPHSYSGCAQHAPDEHILLPLCREALQIMTGLYWDLGEAADA